MRVKSPRIDTRWIEAALLAAGIALLGVWVALFGLTFTDPDAGSPASRDILARPSRAAAPASHTFIAAVLYRPAGPSHPAARPHDHGALDVVGRIDMPRAGISAQIAREPATSGADGGSALLDGQASLAVVEGEGEAFYRGLGQMKPGDPIYLSTEAGDAAFEVEQTAILSPDDARSVAAANAAGAWLTLVTNYPFVRPFGTAPQRFVVRARPTPS